MGWGCGLEGREAGKDEREEGRDSFLLSFITYFRLYLISCSSITLFFITTLYTYLSALLLCYLAALPAFFSFPDSFPSFPAQPLQGREKAA